MKTSRDRVDNVCNAQLPVPPTFAAKHPASDQDFSCALVDSPFAEAGAHLAYASDDADSADSAIDLTPRAVHGHSPKWVPMKQYLDAVSTAESLQRVLRQLRHVHSMALERLGVQTDRVAELESDMNTAREVLGAQADMIANFDATMQQRIRDALAPIAGAAEEVAAEQEDDDEELDNRVKLMVLSADATSIMLY